MAKNGTLSGLGKLWDGAKDLGPVRYEIHTAEEDGHQRGDGTLRWSGFGPWDKFQAGKALMLMVKTGEQVNLTITNPRKEGADILATGPMPDPVDWFADDR